MPLTEFAVGPETYPDPRAIGGLALAENLDLLTQSQEISDRASDVIINCVARYPQSTAGDAIVADRILDQLNPEQHPDTGIGIREVALIEPDPNHCADAINKLHDAFHIPYRVTSEQAGKRVFGFAGSALEEIRTTAVQVTTEQNIPLPEELTSSLIAVDMGVFSGEWKIDKEKAFSLDGYLNSTPNMREAVAAVVKARANELRAHTREQQAFAQTQVSQH